MATGKAEFRYVTTALYQSGGSPNSVLSELPFTDVNFTSQLNSYGTFQGSVLLSGINSTNLDAYDGTIPGKTILWVLYADPITFTSIPVWSGVIVQREYDSASQHLSITAQEMVSLYMKRRISTNLTYTAQNPAAIAKALFEYAEAKTPHGNTGLTYATVPVTGYSTTRTYNGYEYKSVYQGVKDLAQNFFDFVIKPYNTGGVLTNKLILGADFAVTGQPHVGTAYTTSSLTASVFQFPGNVISYKFPEDASGAANRLYGLGYGANSEKLIATAIDPAKLTTGDWPLLEDSANYIDIADVQLLRDVTLGQLNATSYPPTTIEVVVAPYNDPYYPSYNIGDEVRLDIRDDYFPTGLTLILRIVGISVNPGENGPSRITLTLTRQLAAGTVS